MSEWYNELVVVKDVRKHPNADTLSIATIHGGYNVIFKTGDFQEGDLAAYISVDSLVPVNHPYFAFLDTGKGKEYERIKAKKLRGVFSMGLLVPNPLGESGKEGDDVTEVLGIKKYLPPAERENTGTTPFSTHKKERHSETRKFELRLGSILACLYIVSMVLVDNLPVNLLTLVLTVVSCYSIIRWNRWANKRPNYPMYDIDGYRKYQDIFEEGEEVWLSEKIHGCSMSACHTGRRFHVKSRTVFREDIKNGPSLGEYKQTKGDVYWMVAKRYNLKEKLKSHPNIVLFGEVYGKVQDLTYGVSDKDEVDFAAFDAMYLDTRKYMDVGEFMDFCRKIDVPIVPTLYQGPWNKDLVSLAEGKSVIRGANNIREGWVCKPMLESKHPLIGRKLLKLAGEGYLTRKE